MCMGKAKAECRLWWERLSSVSIKAQRVLERVLQADTFPGTPSLRWTQPE